MPLAPPRLRARVRRAPLPRGFRAPVRARPGPCAPAPYPDGPAAGQSASAPRVHRPPSRSLSWFQEAPWPLAPPLRCRGSPRPDRPLAVALRPAPRRDRAVRRAYRQPGQPGAVWGVAKLTVPGRTARGPAPAPGARAPVRAAALAPAWAPVPARARASAEAPVWAPATVRVPGQARGWVPGQALAR